MKKIVALAMAAAASVAASPAAAQSVQISDDGNYRISIPYGDLNLSSPAGFQALERRVQVAARNACGAPNSPSFQDLALVQSCRDGILERARPQLSLVAKGNGRGSVTQIAAR